MLQSKCLRLVTVAPWYLSNRQIHEDLGVPSFDDHIRALTASFDSRLADVGNPLVLQLGRYLLWPRVVPVARSVKQERQVPAAPKAAGGKSKKKPATTSPKPSQAKPKF